MGLQRVKCDLKKKNTKHSTFLRTSLAVQTLRLLMANAGARVQSLVRELRSHLLA